MSGVAAMVLALGVRAAEPAPVDLEWDAPRGCPDKQRVLAEIEGFLAPEVIEAGAEPLQAKGRVERVDDAWVLHLVVESSGGRVQRTLDDDDCDTLASAAALVVAVMAEPSAVLAEVETRTKQAAPQPSPVPKTPPPTPQKPEPALRGFVDARGVMTWGAAPGIGGGVGVGGGLLIGRVRVGVEGLVDVPRIATAPDTIPIEGAGARIGLGVAIVRGCYAPGTKRIEVPLCATFEAGALWARGVELEEGQTEVAPWVAAGIRSGLAVVVHRFVVLRADVEGVVPFLRAGFVATDRATGSDVIIYETPAIGARAGGALEIRFP